MPIQSHIVLFALKYILFFICNWFKFWLQIVLMILSKSLTEEPLPHLQNIIEIFWNEDTII